MKLRGILDFSMGNFLCLRGYVKYKKIANASTGNDAIQRKLIPDHENNLATFLNGGEYRFFPEVILSTSMEFDNNFDEINNFYNSLQQNEQIKKFKCGYFNLKIRYQKFGEKETRLAELSFDEQDILLNRIDGNHRLSAASQVKDDFKIPFCLLLFQTKNHEEQFSSVIFHNINTKQIPLTLEENLKVIIDNDTAFSDKTLMDDPSFGLSYFLARKTKDNKDFEKFIVKWETIKKSKYSYLVATFEKWLHQMDIHKDKHNLAIEQFISNLPRTTSLLKEMPDFPTSTDIAAIEALTFYSMIDEEKASSFLRWIKDNYIFNIHNLKLDDLINIFDKIYDNSPKEIFVSMKFCDKTLDTFTTLCNVVESFNHETGMKLHLNRVDKHSNGYSSDIFGKIKEGIVKSSLVIADLSYGSHNVHHEIGLAQGFGKKILLIYQQRDGSEPNEEIGSNISMYDQVRYKNQTELQESILNRLHDFFASDTSQ